MLYCLCHYSDRYCHVKLAEWWQWYEPYYAFPIQVFQYPSYSKVYGLPKYSLQVKLKMKSATVQRNTGNGRDGGQGPYDIILKIRSGHSRNCPTRQRSLKPSDCRQCMICYQVNHWSCMVHIDPIRQRQGERVDIYLSKLYQKREGT